MDQQAEAKLVIVGNASPDEKPEAAAERSLNVRQYLTQEKGIDPGRIEVRVGDTSGRTVNNTLVPAGAIFNETNTETFDERAITRTGQAYGVSRAHSGTSQPAKRPTHRPRHKAAVSAAPTGVSYSPPATSETPPASSALPPGGSTLSQLPK